MRCLRLRRDLRVAWARCGRGRCLQPLRRGHALVTAKAEHPPPRSAAGPPEMTRNACLQPSQQRITSPCAGVGTYRAKTVLATHVEHWENLAVATSLQKFSDKTNYVYDQAQAFDDFAATDGVKAFIPAVSVWPRARTRPLNSQRHRRARRRRACQRWRRRACLQDGCCHL